MIMATATQKRLQHRQYMHDNQDQADPPFFLQHQADPPWCS
jgi:hypothetical protein